MKPNDFIEITAFDRGVPAELSADYILPDTYPDVKKILRVNAKPILIGRYLSGRRLELSGAIDYAVLFSAEGDGGESVHCVHFAGEWNAAANDFDSADGANITVTPNVSACTVRLANPRKLTLKSTVMCDIKMCVPATLEPSVEGAATKAEESALEKLTKTVSARRERTFIAEPLRISDDIEPDAAQPAIDEIVCIKASVAFNEARLITDGDFCVSLKGVANVDCFYKSQGEAGVYKSFTRKIPVAYTVGANEYEDYFSACRPETLTAHASATTVEINANVAENDYGERRSVELDVSADVTVHIIGAEDVMAVLDAYSVSRDSECVMREYRTPSPAKVINTSFSVGEALSRETLGIPDGAAVVNADVEIGPAESSYERGRLQITGSAQLSCIICEGGSYSEINASLPIKYESGIGEMSAPINASCTLSASDLRTRIDGDRMYVDFEVLVCAEVSEKQCLSAVSAIRLTGEAHTAKAGAMLTLCYPSSSDTLWQVAKRYKTTVAALEVANPDNSSVLLIPPTCSTIVI